jgi:mono/diheme cytochrome c family protein
MERNVLEALGSGAIVDLKKFDSTVNFENLYELETMTHAFAAPVWPDDLLPAIDADLAETGRKIFEGEAPYEATSKGNCISCHNTAAAQVERDLKVFPQFSLADMQTDPNHAENFNRPIDGGHGEFFAVIQGLAGNITNRYYTRYGISQDLQALWEDNRKPVDWRSPIDAPLPGRPLSAVWSTAPYLHNGSVPTLYDLLLPSDDRPTTFTTGTFRYDPVKVGFETNAPDAIFVFEVNAPAIDGDGKTHPEIANGNSNRGHEFGVDLTDEERWALVEFMKTL